MVKDGIYRRRIVGYDDIRALKKAHSDSKSNKSHTKVEGSCAGMPATPCDGVVDTTNPKWKNAGMNIWMLNQPAALSLCDIPGIEPEFFDDEGDVRPTVLADIPAAVIEESPHVMAHILYPGCINLDLGELKRTRCLKYLEKVRLQRTGDVPINPTKDNHGDLIFVDIPDRAVGFVTGRRGESLRTVEAEWECLIMFVDPESHEAINRAGTKGSSADEEDKEEEESGSKKPDKLVIFGPSAESRIGAMLRVMDAIDFKMPKLFAKSGEDIPIDEDRDLNEDTNISDAARYVLATVQEQHDSAYKGLEAQIKKLDVEIELRKKHGPIDGLSPDWNIANFTERTEKLQERIQLQVDAEKLKKISALRLPKKGELVHYEMRQIIDRLMRSSGAVVDFLVDHAFFFGTEAQIERGMKYLEW